jgi:hypothetical protein
MNLCADYTKHDYRKVYVRTARRLFRKTYYWTCWYCDFREKV